MTAWASAVQALQLFAADPIGLGGIAIRAGAGPVRDRYLSLLLGALPSGTQVRRIPLNVGDDRLLGGLDLAATLTLGRPVEQKGLLAEADGGIVVLPMAERIEAGSAGRLCAAIDDGSVTLQRDGLSGVSPARFGVVALDEGDGPDERVAQSLLDRLAFLVDLTAIPWREAAAFPPQLTASPDPSHPDPSNIVMAGSGRPPATRDKDVPSPSWPNLSRPSAPEPNDATETSNAEAIATLCAAALALGIDSPRAPLFAIRAARAAAALDDRTAPDPDDLSLAAALVLAPRATRLPAPPESEPETTQEDQQPDPDPDDSAALPDRPLEDVVLEAALATLPPDLLAQLANADPAKGAARAPGRAGQTKLSTKRGRPIGTRQGEPRNGARLHLLETLKAAAPWQTLRRRPGEDRSQRRPGDDRFQVRRDDFRIFRFRQRIGTTTVFAVDASGSAAMQRLGEAKGAVELLLADCYVRRDQVALIAFRGRDAQLLLPPTGSLLRAKRSLAGLPGGGPTPLAAGINAALSLAETIRRTGRTPVVTLLTDARANIGRDGQGGRPRAESEAMDSARALRASGIASLLVDTSPRPNPFARRLAEAMGARYVPLPYADASALTNAVRAAA